MRGLFCPDPRDSVLPEMRIVPGPGTWPTEVRDLGEALSTTNPAALRELFGRMVSKITCRWEKSTTPAGFTRCRLVVGEVELKAGVLSPCGAHVSA